MGYKEGGLILQEIFLKRFKGKEVYIVGGAVRDKLLNKAPNDIDLVAKVHPSELEEMGAKFIDPTSSFPVFSMVVEPYGRVEIALPRTEKKKGIGHKGFEVEFDHTIPIEKDLERRDFTVNSMAIRISDNKLIDPFNGQTDLKQRILRHTSEAFKDDPLRVKRALRFSCYGFSIAEETQAIMLEMEEELKTLPMERIFKEVMKAMEAEFPHRFFHNMVAIGVGREIFSSIHKMATIPAGPKEYHGDETVLEHSLDILKKVSKRTTNPAIRLAGFLHDYGKIFTEKSILPKHYKHEEKTKELNEFLCFLKADKTTKRICLSVLSSHMRAGRLENMRISKRIKFIDSLVKGNTLESVLIVSEEDSGTELSNEFNKLKRICNLKSQELGITSEHLKGKSGIQISNLYLARRIKAWSKNK
jgi:tRNA nucleotidyltransferase (CCA-adding enzyme)